MMIQVALSTVLFDALKTGVRPDALKTGVRPDALKTEDCNAA